jgi:hypothetical protein
MHIAKRKKSLDERYLAHPTETTRKRKRKKEQKKIKEHGFLQSSSLVSLLKQLYKFLELYQTVSINPTESYLIKRNKIVRVAPIQELFSHDVSNNIWTDWKEEGQNFHMHH